MFFAHGHYVNVNNMDTKPSIIKPEAMENFARYKNIPIKDVSNYIAELIIKEIPEKTDTLPVLVYRVYLYADYPQNNEIGFIDAHTGKLLMTEPAKIDFSATGTFVTRYSGVQQGITHNYQGGYHLVDSTRRAIIHTWNLEGRTNISSRVDITDNDNNWTQTEHHSTNNDMGLDVQWALQRIYDRLYTTHDINSMDNNDGNGFTVNAHIRDGTDPNNAFWSPVERTLSFGEGGSIFRSLASVDVIAHEFGHGITQFQINWNNTTDQRAFNEGLSDIWGAIMEQRIRPNSVWQIGEQLTIGYACLRNIQNTNANDARDKIANTFGSAQYNSGNSYVRGGVFSHWFYLLANGDTGTNDLGRSYSVRGIGMDNAENLIIKAVYEGYLRFTTSYEQIRTSMVNAAREIAGANSFLEHQVENAWYAVGVGNTQYQYNISGPSQLCDQATYTIDLPTGASVVWSTSSQLAVASGQGTAQTIISKQASSSAASIRADITINGNTFSVTKTGIKVGTQAPSIVLYDSQGRYMIAPPYYTGTSYKIVAYGSGMASEPRANFRWTVSPPASCSDCFTSLYAGWSFPFTAEYVGDYDFKLKYYNASECGWSDEISTDFYFYQGPISFSIYPNPASDQLTVKLDASSDVTLRTLSGTTSTTVEPYSIELWNERSGLVHSVVCNESVVNIPLQNLPKGLYFVHLKTKDKPTQKKILRVE